MQNQSFNPPNQYVDIKNNGRIFPTWIAKNFKQYKLPPILRGENEDPCNVKIKLELRKYQEFIGSYLGPGSPYNEILLYHGLGSGKTATSINLYNILYNHDPHLNTIILIKASLRDDPWMKDLREWLGKDPGEENETNITKRNRFKNLHFVHYDSPYADKDFFETIKKIDTSYPTMYIIDEMHGFIRNVYSNINSQKGQRAQLIYEYIVREKKENKNTKVILISATPGVNVPFEFALIFNMLRPGIFPTSELEFDKTFVTDSNYPILNPEKKNMFQRRIMGLVSYYIGATPDLYATQDLEYVTLPMSEYQYNVYRVFEKKEADVQKKAQRFGKSSQLYRTYTRQACNFVFPLVSSNISGELRPRPNNFQITDKKASDIETGKDSTSDEADKVKRYFAALNNFIGESEKYFKDIHKEDVKKGKTIYDDLGTFAANFSGKYDKKFLNFVNSGDANSKLFTEMYKCSPKMLAIVFMTYISPGKVMVYSNYVVMEGIDMLKVYYRLIGYDDYKVAKEGSGFCEYHGQIDKAERLRTKDMYNDDQNVRGSKCKVILLSPSATEGIQLYNIRQEHILEPYWTEVRILQVVGRGIRQCSHKQLPMNERHVNVYRYKVTKPAQVDDDDTIRPTADEIVEDLAKAKDNLIQSFLAALREGAVDCELFKNHNMMTMTYQCFKFPEVMVMGKHAGPAYKEDLKEDVKYDAGLGAKNTKVERIKVIKIKAVSKIGVNRDGQPEYSEEEEYWYYPVSKMVYDYVTHYPVGMVEVIDDIASKLSKDVYIINDLVNIPTIAVQ